MCDVSDVFFVAVGSCLFVRCGGEGRARLNGGEGAGVVSEMGSWRFLVGASAATVPAGRERNEPIAVSVGMRALPLG